MGRDGVTRDGTGTGSAAGTALDAVRLVSVISPLRRTLLAAARERERLPELPDAQIEILRALPRGVLSAPGDLATTLGLSRPAVSNLLTAMERAGLVSRVPRPDDRRRVDVAATEHALDLLDRFDAASAAIVREAAARMTSDELRSTNAALDALDHLREILLTERREHPPIPDDKDRP